MFWFGVEGWDFRDQGCVLLRNVVSRARVSQQRKDGFHLDGRADLISVHENDIVDDAPAEIKRLLAHDLDRDAVGKGVDLVQGLGFRV